MYKGVKFSERTGMYIAFIYIEGKYECIGRYYTEIKAAKAYNERAVEVFGDNAELNNIMEDKKLHEKPEGKSPYPKKPYFCPYCGCWTSIVKQRYYKRTACCGISTMDYELRKCNKLF